MGVMLDSDELQDLSASLHVLLAQPDLVDRIRGLVPANLTAGNQTNDSSLIGVAAAAEGGGDWRLGMWGVSDGMVWMPERHAVASLILAIAQPPSRQAEDLFNTARDAQERGDEESLREALEELIVSGALRHNLMAAELVWTSEPDPYFDQEDILNRRDLEHIYADLFQEKRRQREARRAALELVEQRYIEEKTVEMDILLDNILGDMETLWGPG